MEPSGFLSINKPQNWTSFDVIAKLRRLTGQRKIGHAGTLDPFATGVLVVAFNKARFLIDLVQAQEKVYRGRLRLGQTSDTDDLDGQKTTIKVTKPPKPDKVRASIKKFIGRYQQIPPKFSALKVQGRKMYELARLGLPIERKPRPVIIYALKLLAYDYPHLDLEARVSKGTYIRALARDIGTDLKTGGFLEKLTRTSVGGFTLQDAVDFNDLDKKRWQDLLAPLETVIKNLPKIALTKSQINKITQGQPLVLPKNMATNADKSTLAVVNPQNRLLMLVLYDKQTNGLKLKKIFDESLRH